jgi:hypothetical protein
MGVAFNGDRSASQVKTFTNDPFHFLFTVSPSAGESVQAREQARVRGGICFAPLD